MEQRTIFKIESTHAQPRQNFRIRFFCRWKTECRAINGIYV